MGVRGNSSASPLWQLPAAAACLHPRPVEAVGTGVVAGSDDHHLGDPLVQGLHREGQGMDFLRWAQQQGLGACLLRPLAGRRSAGRLAPAPAWSRAESPAARLCVDFCCPACTARFRLQAVASEHPARTARQQQPGSLACFTAWSSIKALHQNKQAASPASLPGPATWFGHPQSCTPPARPPRGAPRCAAGRQRRAQGGGGRAGLLGTRRRGQEATEPPRLCRVCTRGRRKRTRVSAAMPGTARCIQERTGISLSLQHRGDRGAMQLAQQQA